MRSYTDIEQSKKLAEILPVESADMYWWYNGQKYYVETKEHNDFQKSDIPCWSLAALLKMLKNYQLFSNGLIVYIDNESYKINSDNPVDACVNMIILLKENKKL